MSDLVERLREKIADANNFNGNLLKEWDAIRAACLRRRGSDLPRRMFEAQIENFTDLMTEAAAEIERLREQLVKRTAALQEIADSTLYYGADLRSIASAALTDDQQN